MFDLQKSPIRKNITGLKEGQLSIFEDDKLLGIGEKDGESIRKYQARTILKDVENMIGTMEGNKNKKIKIAVMGEVKAGKSTFINTCVEKEIAYTDILEATAVVSEITYSKHEFVRIIDINGSVVKECSFEELLAWTREKLDNMEDFSEYGKIEIGVDNEKLENLILVDTPGLLSITSENHDVTNEYVAQTDYILWVIDSENLGSKEVNDYIDKIKLSGKPLIGIINKVDTEEILLEIKDYIEKEYGNTFEEIFYISAASAWNSYKNKEVDWYRNSGFYEIWDCIEELAVSKDYSNARTQYYQLQRDKEVHLQMKAIVMARKKFYDSELGVFAQINSDLRRIIATELSRWLKEELYMEERRILMEASGEAFKNSLHEYASAEYLTGLIDEKYKEIACFICKRWDYIEKGVMQNSSRVLVDFKYDIDFDFYETTNVDGVDEEHVAAWTKEGMKKGALIGLAFAGFEAWLGPAAATVTFASAILPEVLPLVIGGALIANFLAKKNINTEEIEKNAKKKKELVDDLYNEVIKVTKKEVRSVEQTLYDYSDSFYKERCSFYKEKAEQVNFDFTEPNYGMFISELDEYIQLLDNNLSAENKDIIQEPPKFEI